jgi:amidase
MQLGGDGLRVGVKDSIDIAGYPTRAGSAALADAPPAVRHAAVRNALADATIAVTPIYLPCLEDAFEAGLTIIGAETWAAFEHLVDSKALGADVRTRLLAARDITRDALVAAEACRSNFRAEVNAVLERVDALALPTLPTFRSTSKRRRTHAPHCA